MDLNVANFAETVNEVVNANNVEVQVSTDTLEVTKPSIAKACI